jgi:hypothetical protein
MPYVNNRPEKDLSMRKFGLQAVHGLIGCCLDQDPRRQDPRVDELQAELASTREALVALELPKMKRNIVWKLLQEFEQMPRETDLDVALYPNHIRETV